MGTRRYTVALAALPRRLRRAIARTPAPQLRRRLLRWGATAVVVLGIATATAAQSQGTLPIIFNLVNLSSTSTPAGSILNGGARSDNAGGSVADAGDVNGDGFDDVIIGASGADPGGSNSGAAYVVFGTATGIPDIANLATDITGSNGFVLVGAAAYDFAGFAVSGAGDVNGDGFDDVIISARGANSFAGAAYVVFGGSAPPATVKLANADIVLQGAAAYDYAGTAVSGAGDVNGDGFADVIIGADRAAPNGNRDAEAAYVVFGSHTPSATPVNLGTDADIVLQGAAAGDRAGRAVSGAGDVNDDGFADVIVGAYGVNVSTGGGVAYVVHGQASSTPTTPVLTLNFTIGRAGSAFVVRGTGYPANTLQRVRVNGTTVGTIAIGTDGQWALVLQTKPQQAAGVYRVTLEAVAPSTQSTAPLATFTVDPAAPLRASSDGGVVQIIAVPPSVRTGYVVYLPAVVDVP